MRKTQKSFAKIFGIILALCMAFSVLALSACGDDDEKPKTDTYTVTFDSDGGSAVAAQKVKSGNVAQKPNDPTKADSEFQGWFLGDAEDAYDFGTPVTSNITLKAHWGEAGSTVTVTFYNGETVVQTEKVAKGGRVRYTGVPDARLGYVFDGWYTQDGATKYVSGAKYDEDANYYAKWLREYVFEAENTQLTGLGEEDITGGLANAEGNKIGHGFSNDTHGVQLIKSNSQASGGKYISGLYYQGAYLQFEITSDKALEDVTIDMMLSATYTDMPLGPNNMLFEVNGDADTYAFPEVKLGNGAADETQEGVRGGFKSVKVQGVSLNAGKNIIKIIVDNSSKPMAAGSMHAYAPTVDCIKIRVDESVTLTMTEYENK